MVSKQNHQKLTTEQEIVQFPVNQIVLHPVFLHASEFFEIRASPTVHHYAQAETRYVNNRGAGLQAQPQIYLEKAVFDV